MMFPGRTLLTCWLTMVLTGAVVTHRHEAAPGHTHHLGWAALPTGPGPDDLSFAHRHFLLLGIEFGAVTGPAVGDGGCDGTHPTAGEYSPTEAGGTTAVLTLDCHLPAAPDGFTGSTAGLAPSSTSAFGEFRPFPCALMSHSRTGVLRS